MFSKILTIAAGSTFSTKGIRWALVFACVMATSLTCGPSRQTTACPFCAAVSQTFSQEFQSTDLVVIAKLVQHAPNLNGGDARASDVTKAVFEVTRILKGEEFIEPKLRLDAVYFGTAEIGDSFLMTGMEPPRPLWSSPIRVNERELEYLVQLNELPASGPERLKFFLGHLEDSSPMLAQDAYDEFAFAPYAEVIGLKDSMNHDQLVEWITKPETTASRKRLYLTMLGICGGEADLELLESLMTSKDRKQRSGLDAMIACYLTIKGEAGLELINEQFLLKQDAEYADTYAAILAIRFHGTEGDRIERDKLVKSLELLLDRPKVADLVIPDMARWENWEVMDKLVEMFKSTDDETNWVRVPVVNYLRMCPLPEAKVKLAELTKLDPDSVKRAKTFFPLLEQSDAWDDEDESGSDDKEESDGQEESVDGASNKSEVNKDQEEASASKQDEAKQDEAKQDEAKQDEAKQDEAKQQTTLEKASDQSNGPSADESEPEYLPCSETLETTDSMTPTIRTQKPSIGHLQSAESTNASAAPTASPTAVEESSTQFVSTQQSPSEPDATQARNTLEQPSSQSESGLVAQTSVGSTPSPVSVLAFAFLTSVALLLLIWGLLTGQIIGLLS